jgi:uncharacterized protein
MSRAKTMAQLKTLEQHLRAQGVCALYLFGSMGRNEAQQQSDVDLLFDIAPDARFSLFDQARITRQLSEHLHAPVDFIPRRALHPAIRAKVEAEQVRVFG